jgi:hypothetical protein
MKILAIIAAIAIALPIIVAAIGFLCAMSAKHWDEPRYWD